MGNIAEEVHEFETKHKEGFTDKELELLLENYPDVNMEKFDSAMMGNTCMVIDNEVINYHCDVITALRCGLEDRDIRWYEWD